MLGDQRRPLTLGGAKQRALLAVLLLHAGEVVSADRLVDELWGEKPPETVRSVLQVYVANLRKVIEPARPRRAAGTLLRTQPPGYLLDLSGHTLDLDRFEQLRGEGRTALAAGQASEAADQLREALRLWRGPALGDVVLLDRDQGVVAELEERRLEALEERIDADLALGRHRELVGELEALVVAHPLRERLRGQHMLALYRAGRQADALQVYRVTRDKLIEELGIEPAAELRELEALVLAQDPRLRELGDAYPGGQPTNLARATTSSPAMSRSEQADRVWNIPSPVRSFTGREQQLAHLRNQLTSNQRAALVPVAALHGMGGIGKTQLARAYAYRYRDRYRLAWWIPAETTLTVTAALAELAVRLGAPTELSQPQQLTYAREVLAERDGWLVVFDNATDPVALEPFLPGTGQGHVLVTSRNPAWHGLADPIPVDLLPLGAAAKLLRDRSGDPNQQAAEALAEELGRLPLALEQAAAYASRQRLSLAGYLEVFHERRAELLARGQPLAYDGTVDTAFSLALDRLHDADPAAMQLLQLCALLAPDEIPVALLLDKPDLLPGSLVDAARDPLRRREVTGALYQAALLTHDVDDTVRLHRLVQAVALHHLPDHDRQQLTAQAIKLLGALFPDQPWEPETWPVCARLLTHANAVVDNALRQDLLSPVLANLVMRISGYIGARGLGATRSRELDEQALRIFQRLYHEDHPDIARSLTNLAVDLYQLGDHAAARDRDEQALAMFQRLHDGDHPHTARSLSNLADDLRALGEHAQARDLHQQALTMYQRLYPGDHRDTALCLNDLADDLHALGDYAQARDLHQQALTMYQRLYPGDHPYTALSLNGLADDLHALGDYAQARDLHHQALTMRQRLYEDDHPDTALSLSGLASDLQALGEHSQADEVRQRSLAMDDRLAKQNEPTA